MDFNKFITLEGGEGSGKTTVANHLKTLLEAKGYEVVVTREPGGDITSEKIREIIMSSLVHPKTESHLFAAARIEHINNVIFPSLKAGKIVICDRYVDSSVVYQGYVLGVENVEEINEYAYKNCMPGKTFFFDIDCQVALKRLEDNARDKNRYDKKSFDFHDKIYAGYKDLVKVEKERIIAVDATLSQEEVALEIMGNLEF